MIDLPFYKLETNGHYDQSPQCFASFQLMFLLQGNATVQVTKHLLHLKEHDFLFFNLYELHQFIYLSEDARFLLVQISEDYLKTAIPELLSCSFHTHTVSPADKKQYETFCREFGTFVYHHTVHAPGSQIQALSHLGNILTFLLLHRTSKTVTASAQEKNERLYHALTFINENYTSDLTLPDVAAQVGVHPQYFSKYFKQHTGMTLTEYINQLRIVTSLSEIMNSDHTLLDIALNYGFNNYKTYSIAFKKIFHTTPRAWQKDQQRSQQKKIDPTDSSSIYSFFQNYWEPDTTQNTASETTASDQLTIELSSEPKGTTACGKIPDLCFSIGRAADLLRGDIQQQLRSVTKELPIHHLRLRNIFSDDLFVYYETPEKDAFYNWQYIDMVYDFLTELQIKPYTELGFMPRMLASKQQFANWQHRPNVSFPRSLKNWSRLVENFLKHLIQRYGMQEVLSWKFNMWTSPDLEMKGGYWHESMESFFLFYRVTYNTIKSVNEELSFGGPDFTTPNGFLWYKAFWDYCRQYDMHPDFLTVHLYAEEIDASDQMLKNRYLARQMDSVSEEHFHLYQSFSAFLHLLHEDPDFHNCPIVISDWNRSFHARDYSRDTCFMSSFIAYTVQFLAGTQVTMVGFRSLCDVNEDFFPENRLFCGGPGLLDIHGLKKASYYTFVQINRLGETLLARGANYIFTKSGTHYQLLLFHTAFPAYDDPLLSYEQRYQCYGNVPPISLCAVLDLPSGNYLIRQTEVSRTSGSAYDLWVKMGSPQYDTPEILNYIRAKAIPDCYYKEAAVTDHLLINVELEAHSVVLIEIMKNKTN